MKEKEYERERVMNRESNEEREGKKRLRKRE